MIDYPPLRPSPPSFSFEGDNVLSINGSSVYINGEYDDGNGNGIDLVLGVAIFLRLLLSNVPRYR
jgi:hypothetical protein